MKLLTALFWENFLVREWKEFKAFKKFRKKLFEKKDFCICSYEWKTKMGFFIFLFSLSYSFKIYQGISELFFSVLFCKWPMYIRCEHQLVKGMKVHHALTFTRSFPPRHYFRMYAEVKKRGKFIIFQASILIFYVQEDSWSLFWIVVLAKGWRKN